MVRTARQAQRCGTIGGKPGEVALRGGLREGLPERAKDRPAILRFSGGSGILLVLLFSFQLSLFLGGHLGRFLFFLFAFVFASLFTHDGPFVLDSDWLGRARPKTPPQILKLAHDWTVCRRLIRSSGSSAHLSFDFKPGIMSKQCGDWAQAMISHILVQGLIN